MGRTIAPTTAAAPLATLDDYLVHVGPVADTATARVEALLASSSASIRTFTNRTITRATATERCVVNRWRVNLKERPIHTVSAVVAAGTETAVAYTIPRDGRIEFDPAALATSTGYLTEIDVTYEHGLDADYDPSGILPAVVGICCTIAARAFGVKPETAGVTSETISGYTYQLGAAAAAGGVGLLPSEQLALRRLFKQVRAGSLEIA